ncbi:MAG: hypothetical protein HKN89_01005 [Eudoraea sp.]|nr:hypothetical protein [Eudoraea sp.]
MKNLLLVVGLLVAHVSSYGQHHNTHESDDLHEPFFRTSLTIAHTYLPKNTVEGAKNIILPTVALDFEYWMNHTWGVGLHNDLELLNFEVKESDDQIYIEREFPVLVTLDGLFSPTSGVVLFAGPGIEFERNKNYFVFRGGIELEIPISEHWDLAPMLFYDMRNRAYNTITIGLGVGYRI